MADRGTKDDSRLELSRLSHVMRSCGSDAHPVQYIQGHLVVFVPCESTEGFVIM